MSVNYLIYDEDKGVLRESSFGYIYGNRASNGNYEEYVVNYPVCSQQSHAFCEAMKTKYPQLVINGEQDDCLDPPTVETILSEWHDFSDKY